MAEPLEVQVTFHIEAPDTPDREVSHSVTLNGFPPYQKGDVVNVKLQPDLEIKPFKVTLIEHFLYPNSETEGVDKIGMIVHLQDAKPKPVNWEVY